MRNCHCLFGKFGNMYKDRIKKINYLIIVSSSLIIGLSGCNNSVGDSGNSSQVDVATNLTIDSAGTIPVFADMPTTTQIYVHNQGNRKLNNISYSLNLPNGTNSSTAINGDECHTLDSGQSCALTITTPRVTLQDNQGSMLLKANYELDSQRYSFSQLVNYKLIESTNVQNEVKFSSGAVLHNYGHTQGYATLYLYATGTNSQKYQLNDMSVTNNSFKISKSAESVIATRQVQAIEISGIAASVTTSTSLNVNATVMSNQNKVTLKRGVKQVLSTQLSDSVVIAADPINAGAILTTSSVPLINTVNTTSGTMVVQNAGNQPANIGTISAGTGISLVSGCSNQTLAMGETCNIQFEVSESGGSANITVPYTGGNSASIAGNVTWFNGIGSAFVAMSASNNPTIFAATTSGSTTINLTNVGGYTLTNLSIATPVIVSGSASATISNNTCSNVLNIGASCSYDVILIDNNTDINQQINLGVSANYAAVNGNQSYNRVMPLTYSATSYAANMSLTPAIESVVILGNGSESNTSTLVILNSGNAPVNLTFTGLGGNVPAYLTATTTCGSTLQGGESCPITIKLGATLLTTESSGQAAYTVNYSASGQSTAGSVTSTINWQVQAFNPNLLIFVTTQGYKGGSILLSANNSTPAPDPLLTSGLAAGDYLCNLQAATSPSTYPGTYKALLAGANRIPGGSDWVLQANKTYINQSGSIIGVADADAKLPSTLTNQISTNDDFVWSGFNTNWGIASDNCSTWSSVSSGNGTIGSSSALNYLKFGYPPGYLSGDEGDGLVSSNCYGSEYKLYCVQQ